MKTHLFIILLLLICVKTYSQKKEMLDYKALSERSAEELFKKAGEYLQHNQEDTAVGYYISLVGKYNKDMSKAEKYWCAVAYNQIGWIYHQKENHINAFNMYLKALKIAQQNDFYDLQAELNKNMGNIYCVFQDLESGKKYYLAALQIARENGNKDVEAKTLNNLINASCCSGEVEQAKKYYQETLSLLNLNPAQKFYQYRNSAYIHIMENEVPQAITQYRQAAAYVTEKHLEDNFIQAAYMEMGNLYESINNVDSALYFCQLSTENWSNKHINVITSNLRLLYRIRQRFKNNEEKFKKYDKLYWQMSDSLFNLYYSGLANNGKFIYEMNHNQQEIEALTLEKEQKEEKIERQRYIFLGVTTFSIIVIALLSIVYYQKRKLLETYKELFLKNKREIESKQYEKQQTNNWNSETDDLNEHKLSDATKSLSKNTYVSSKLSTEQKNMLLEKIKIVMEDTKEFCNNDFGMNSLCELVGSNSSYISQIINEEYHVNFRTYINQFRIHEAQVRLLDIGQYGSYTIKTIAESVGYKSQSNFIELFKKETGMSPSAYQKMAKLQL